MSASVSEQEAKEEAVANMGGDAAREAGRGGLAVAFAKVYFIAQGLVQQIALPRVLEISGYGAWSTVNSIAGIAYNPLVAMSIQGVSRAVASAEPSEQSATLHRVLRVHAVLAVWLGATFWLLGPWVCQLAGAPHVVEPARMMSAVMVIYGMYAPLIGALNGRRRFLAQAGFDVLAATLRTTGLVVGAWLLAKSGRGLEGAAGGFVVSMSLLLILALSVVGVGRPGKARIRIADHVAFLVPVLFGQLLLNLLLQADLTLLRRFAADAAVAKGLDFTAADPLVGAYRATQLFSFLPYQLLISVNFILFPMLARAVHEGDRAAIARYVATGVRIALLIAGLMVSVTAGLSSKLLHLVFGSEVAKLGGSSLELLSLGFGVFALFGVLTTVLNSLRRERASAGITAIAVAAVALMCFLRVRGAEFGETLLFRTATATSAGLLLATLCAAFLVRRAAGAVVAPLSVLRVLGAVAVMVSVGQALPDGGKLLTVVSAAFIALGYASLLIILRELGKDDLGLVLRVLKPKR
ncbi:MAG: lipopolysaccharide biosynthesis protein [Polyangiaceae bacterium]